MALNVTDESKDSTREQENMMEMQMGIRTKTHNHPNDLATCKQTNIHIGKETEICKHKPYRYNYTYTQTHICTNTQTHTQPNKQTNKNKTKQQKTNQPTNHQANHKHKTPQHTKASWHDVHKIKTKTKQIQQTPSVRIKPNNNIQTTDKGRTEKHKTTKQISNIK